MVFHTDKGHRSKTQRIVLIPCNILAIFIKKQETAFGGDQFILDSRFRGNDKRSLHFAKVLRFRYDVS